MNDDAIRRTVLDCLCRVAPEADRERLDPGANLRDQLDIDSMDFLNFVIAMHEAFSVDIPETDYSKVATIDGCVRYLAARTAASRP